MAPNGRWILTAAAIMGTLGIALGAFGAHGLEARLAELGTTETWKTAAQYHLVHAVALLALAVLAERLRITLTAIAFVVGITVFSGTLYLLSVTGIKWLGAITPLGGVAFIVGWLSLLRTKPNVTLN